MNENIERVRFRASRCLDIYLGRRPDTDCAECEYKHLGANCVFALIDAQDKIIKEAEDEQIHE